MRTVNQSSADANETVITLRRELDHVRQQKFLVEEELRDREKTLGDSLAEAET